MEIWSVEGHLKGGGLMIIGQKVFIRAVEIEDLPDIHKWSNDFEIMEQYNFKINFTNFEGSARVIHDNSGREDCLDFTIVERETKKPVGKCSLTEIDYSNKKCLCTIYIGDAECRENGYGTEALYLLMRFVFDDLGFNRMGLWVFDFNKRAIKGYKRCGMKVEGIMREGVYRNGMYHDVYFMGILRNEYVELAREGGVECSEANM